MDLPSETTPRDADRPRRRVARLRYQQALEAHEQEVRWWLFRPDKTKHQPPTPTPPGVAAFLALFALARPSKASAERRRAAYAFGDGGSDLAYASAAAAVAAIRGLQELVWAFAKPVAPAPPEKESEPDEREPYAAAERKKSERDRFAASEGGRRPRSYEADRSSLQVHGLRVPPVLYPRPRRNLPSRTSRLHGISTSEPRRRRGCDVDIPR